MDALATETPLPAPLSTLTAEEQIIQETVRKFARKEIAPLVREMDEAQKMSPKIIQRLFELGLMGIEIPEEYGGVGGSFFSSILAVEEISAVDPAIGVLVDVQNTLTVNALLRWGTDAQKQQYLPRMASDTICSYALSRSQLRLRRLRPHHQRACRRRPLHPQRPQALDLQRRRGRPLHRLHHRRSHGRLQGHHSLPR